MSYCTGCETPEAARVNLPKEWKPGDALPKNLTIHNNEDGSQFVFRGATARQDRIKLEQLNAS